MVKQKITIYFYQLSLLVPVHPLEEQQAHLIQHHVMEWHLHFLLREAQLV